MTEWSRHREMLTKAAVVPCQVTARAAGFQDRPSLNNAQAWTRDWHLTGLALRPRLGKSSNAMAKDHFPLPAGEQDNADDDRRQDQYSVSGIGLMASEKRFWRQSNNPIAARKFPGWCLHQVCIFVARAEPGGDAVGLLNATLNASMHRLARLQAPGLRGPDKNVGWLKPQNLCGLRF
jgi:hypothetical protein